MTGLLHVGKRISGDLQSYEIGAIVSRRGGIGLHRKIGPVTLQGVNPEKGDKEWTKQGHTTHGKIRQLHNAKRRIYCRASVESG